MSAPAVWAFTVPGYEWRHHPAAVKCARYVETSIADLAGTTGIAAIRTQDELDADDETPPRLWPTSDRARRRSMSR